MSNIGINWPASLDARLPAPRSLRSQPRAKRDIARALGALAQETRLDILQVLAANTPEGCSAGCVAKYLGVRPSTLSFHLQQLDYSGFVSSERRGRTVIYRLEVCNLETLASLIGGLGARTESHPAPIPEARRDSALVVS
jgi:DNA-binding transcriptional ArsR family regulator